MSQNPNLTASNKSLQQGRAEALAMFHGLRQQAEKANSKEPYLCLSDFIAPKVHILCAGLLDWVWDVNATTSHPQTHASARPPLNHRLKSASRAYHVAVSRGKVAGHRANAEASQATVSIRR